MKDFVSKPAILLQDIWSDKDVNIVEKSHSLGRTKFNLIDISLNSYGQGEERKYIGSSFYRKNIRKGNTIIENPKNKYCQFARKGTPQIFDIRLQHIQYWQQKKNNLDKFQRNVAQIIFENVNTAFEYGKKVELIKIEKVDGANAQISYNYQYDAWIIASQNVSLLASTSQDLSIYKGNRYQSVLIIAQHWFQLIKDFNKERISELKKLLDGYTAVGSLCGHPNYMNIIKYDSVNVKWYAIVDNYSQDFCTDPLNAKKQLQKFNFKCAEMKSIALTSSSDAFYTALQKLYSKTLQANLQDQQFGTQGSIAYFVVRELQKQRQVTVGATSIKTLQFRFFVSIRQKLEKSVIKKQQLIQIAKRLQKQMCELQNVYSGRAPFPHEYYMKILNAIIQLAEILELKETDIKKRFTKLLKLSFYCLFKRISISKHSKFMIEDENFMNRIEQIPLSKYGSLGCKTRIIYIIVGLPGMFKTYLGQKISNHFQKINVPYQIISLEDLQNIENGLSALYKTQQNPLEHFYLDGSFDSESICKIMKYVQKNRDPKSYYKFMLIKDEVKQKFVCSDSNQYPFSIETIIMCYYGQHQHKINSPRIQQKIDNLKLVTNKLRNYANFDEAIGKLNLEQYHYPFSRQSKLGNVHELSKIIVDVLKGQNEKNEFNMYGILILRLQQCEGIQYMREDSINTEIEHLIKASYPSIPIINFKK